MSAVFDSNHRSAASGKSRGFSRLTMPLAASSSRRRCLRSASIAMVLLEVLADSRTAAAFEYELEPPCFVCAIKTHYFASWHLGPVH